MQAFTESVEPRIWTHDILLTIIGYEITWPIWGTEAVPYGNSMSWYGIALGVSLGNKLSDRAALSSVERIRNQQKVLIEEHDSQIYKQGKNFFLKKLL